MGELPLQPTTDPVKVDTSPDEVQLSFSSDVAPSPSRSNINMAKFLEMDKVVYFGSKTIFKRRVIDLEVRDVCSVQELLKKLMFSVVGTFVSGYFIVGA